jgi:hypothetical protein
MGRAARYEATPIRHARDLRLEAPWVWWRRQRTRLGRKSLGCSEPCGRSGSSAGRAARRLRPSRRSRPPIRANQEVFFSLFSLAGHVLSDRITAITSTVTLTGVGVAEVRVDRIELFPYRGNKAACELSSESLRVTKDRDQKKSP